MTNIFMTWQRFCMTLLRAMTSIYSQALGSFKKYMPPPLPYFKVNIYPFPFPTSPQYFFAYL